VEGVTSLLQAFEECDKVIWTGVGFPLQASAMPMPPEFDVIDWYHYKVPGSWSDLAVAAWT